MVRTVECDKKTRREMSLRDRIDPIINALAVFRDDGRNPVVTAGKLGDRRRAQTDRPRIGSGIDVLTVIPGLETPSSPAR